MRTTTNVPEGAATSQRLSGPTAEFELEQLLSSSPYVALLPKGVFLDISHRLRRCWNSHKRAALYLRARGESYSWRIQGMRSCFGGWISLQAVLFPPLDVGPLTLAPIDRAPGADERPP